MLINTAVFGSLEVEDENIFHVPEGLPGFPGCSEYALITRQEDDVTLMWFQAVEANVPCFVVFRPQDLVADYQPRLEPADLRILGGGEDALEYLVIAVVPEDVTKTTVNLRSPIVLNRRERTARQVILPGNNYPIRHPLLQEEPARASV